MASEIDITICGCVIIAAKAPKIVPNRRANKGGVFLIIKTITVKGTINNQGEILKASLMASSLSEISGVPLVSIFNPIIKNIINVIVIVGTVV